MHIKHPDLRFAAAAMLAAGLLASCSGGGSSSAASGAPTAPPTGGAPGPGSVTGPVPVVPDVEGVAELPVLTAEVRSIAANAVRDAERRVQALAGEWRNTGVPANLPASLTTAATVLGGVPADLLPVVPGTIDDSNDFRYAFELLNQQIELARNAIKVLPTYIARYDELLARYRRQCHSGNTACSDSMRNIQPSEWQDRAQILRDQGGGNVRWQDVRDVAIAQAELFRRDRQRDLDTQWPALLALLKSERDQLIAYAEEIRRQVRLDTRRATLEERDQQALLNAGAGTRAPATPQTGQRFARVHHAARRTGAALEFEASFRPHGAADAQRQYQVRTSGSANPNLSINARDDLRYGIGLTVLPAAIPPSSDAGMVPHASRDSGRFPARGTVFRGGLRGSAARVIQDGANLTAGSAEALRRRLQVQGDASDRETDGVADDAHAWQDWHAAPFTTFRYDSAHGWSMGFGGSGVVFADLMRYAAKPEGAASSLAVNQANDDVANNIEITFGDRPAGYAGLDPHLPAFYWNLKTPSLRRDANGALVDGPSKSDTERFDGGRYELLLSSYAGKTAEVFAPPDGRAYRIIRDANNQLKLEITDLEAGLTDAEKEGVRAAGLEAARIYAEERAKLDPELHLKHAAYGLFAFTSRFEGAASLERLQTFHFGRQTFEDTSGSRISDIAGAFGMEPRKYYGRTMGWLLTSADAGDKSADGRISGRHRIRGDVELELEIFASDPDFPPGAIAGEISNLQIEVSTGRWSTSASDVLGTGTAAALRGTIDLNSFGYSSDPAESYGYDLENVNNDGTYSGYTRPESPVDSDFNTLPGVAGFFGGGEFEGALYGRNTRIPETAGTWWVPARLEFSGAEGMIGSFGAFCGEALGCSPLGPDILPDP